jgi:hypothetical protein
MAGPLAHQKNRATLAMGLAAGLLSAMPAVADNTEGGGTEDDSQPWLRASLMVGIAFNSIKLMDDGVEGSALAVPVTFEILLGNHVGLYSRGYAHEYALKIDKIGANPIPGRGDNKDTIGTMRSYTVCGGLSYTFGFEPKDDATRLRRVKNGVRISGIQIEAFVTRSRYKYDLDKSYGSNPESHGFWFSGYGGGGSFIFRSDDISIALLPIQFVQNLETKEHHEFDLAPVRSWQVGLMDIGWAF